MIKVENMETYGWESAIRGMRNPMNSWGKSDSYMGYDCKSCGRIERNGFCEPNKHDCHEYLGIEIGQNDLKLMKKLCKAGTEHRKYARQIFVSMDITTNQTVWSEFDTYKVGTTKNSCSKMHRIHVKCFEKDDFSHEGIDAVGGFTEETFNMVLETLEYLRELFNKTHKKEYWRAMIELLPMGYNLKATVTMTYENVFNIIKQREFHKMFEWVEFVKILKTLPYVKEIIGEQ